MTYNWQQNDWPNFQYNLSPETEDSIISFSEETALITGMLKAIPDKTRADSIIYVMVTEAMKTSEIE